MRVDLQGHQPGREGRVVGDDHPEEHVPEPAEEEGEGDEHRLRHHPHIGHRDLGTIRGGGVSKGAGSVTESVVALNCRRRR
jgi:hypothetical protein